MARFFTFIALFLFTVSVNAQLNFVGIGKGIVEQDTIINLTMDSLIINLEYRNAAPDTFNDNIRLSATVNGSAPQTFVNYGNALINSGDTLSDTRTVALASIANIGPGVNIILIWPNRPTNGTVLGDTVSDQVFYDESNNVYPVQKRSGMVYPNILGETLQVDPKLSRTTFKLYDMAGKELFSGETKDLPGLNMGKLASGQYTLLIRDEKGTYFYEKLIKN